MMQRPAQWQHPKTSVLQIIGGLALGLLSAQSAWAQSAPVAGIYSCTDASGRKLTADRPVPECSDREQRLLNPSGTLKGKIGPQLSDQDRIALEAKRRAAEKEREKQEDVKRRDKTLLARYPNEAVHARGRADALRDTQEIKRVVSVKLDELLLERKTIAQELEFYVHTPERTPPTLTQRSKAVEQGIDVQRKLIAEQDRQLKRINANYDEELSRLQPMWTPVNTTGTP